ncbi:protein JTB isoform X1 [Lutra lutra]|uniref:protein JTB isoform X1 n=1 Tax=Lutra lutra TaxID=9657 RepID=UPI001FD5CC48|nr:protein JTB isoform X1 [Lutra lutra]
MPAGGGRRCLPQGCHLCWLLCAFALKLCQAEVPAPAEKLSVGASNLPCWLVEEFAVAEECAPCSRFQAVSMCSLPAARCLRVPQHRLSVFFLAVSLCVPLNWFPSENVPFPKLMKTTPECGSTGYVEKITCSSSKRNEFKSCRSALMEQHLFWKFEGAIVGVALVFACLVIIRQRQLDRKALEKVRKQIESI